MLNADAGLAVVVVVEVVLCRRSDVRRNVGAAEAGLEIVAGAGFGRCIDDIVTGPPLTLRRGVNPVGACMLLDKDDGVGLAMPVLRTLP